MLSLIWFMSEVLRYIALNACVKYCTKDESKKDQRMSDVSKVYEGCMYIT